VHEDLKAYLIDALRNYRLDALIASLPVGNGEIEYLPLFREPFVAVLPRGHPLAARPRIAAEDVARHRPLVLREENACASRSSRSANRP